MEEKSIKTVANSPVIDNNSYALEVELLNEKVNEEDVCNIGVVAPYGAGKSSLLKTYQNKHWGGRCKSQKYTTISLAGFNENDDDNVKEKSNVKAGVKDINSEIEKSILEQLLFRVGKKDLPNSRINRITRGHLLSSILFAVFFTATLLFAIFAILEFYNILPYSNGKMFYWLTATSAICLLIFLILVFYKNSINKISVKDIEMEFNQHKEGSILNTFIDEIIYYFSKTKVKIVVIEDLDRFKDVSLFAKLRELNFLINNCSLVKQKVTFIYAVKDDLFHSENDRAKFFDYIISIIPVLNHSNSGDLIKKEIEKNPKGMHLPDVYIQEISHFIMEMRLLKNIINDYVTYYKKLSINKINDEHKNVKLFSLMVYKNIKPDDFSNLQFGKGKIAKTFSIKNEKIKEKSDSLKTEISELKDNLTKLDNDYFKKFDALKNSVIGYIIRQANTNNPSNCVDINNQRTFINVNNNYSFTLRNYYTITYYCTNHELTQFYGETLESIEKRIKLQSEEKKKEIIQEIEEKQKVLREIINYSFSEFVEKFLEINVDDELTRFLLYNGYIDESYMYYIVQSGKILMTQNDLELIKNIIAKEKIDRVKDIDNVELVVREIPEGRFSDKYILNNNIVRWLLSYKGAGKDLCSKKAKMLTYLSSLDQNVRSFILNFINVEDEFGIVIDGIVHDCDELSLFVLESNKCVDYKKDLFVSRLFDKKDVNLIVKQNKQNIISEYIENHKDPIGTFSRTEDKGAFFLEVLKKCNIRLQTIDHNFFILDEVYDNVLQVLITYNLYKVNYSNIIKIITFYKRIDESTASKSIITNLFDLNIPELKDNIKGELYDYVSLLLGLEYECEESLDTINFILASEIDNEIKMHFIDKLSVRFNCSKDIDIDILKYAFKKNKICPDWKNIVFAVNNGLGLQELMDYLGNNIKELSNQSLEDNNTVLKICNDIIFEDKETFKELAKSFKLSSGITSIHKDEISAILIDNNIIIADKTVLTQATGRPITCTHIILKNYELIEHLNEIKIPSESIDGLINSTQLSKTQKALIISKTQGYYNCTGNMFDVIGEILVNVYEYEIDFAFLNNILTNLSDKKNMGISIIKNYADRLSREKTILLLKVVEPNIPEIDADEEVKIEKSSLSDEIVDVLIELKLFKVRTLKNYFKLTKAA